MGLVFCASPKTARSLSTDTEIAEALDASGGGDVGAFLPDADAEEGQRSTYWDFVHGKLRVLISTFTLASRGLDYTDIISSAPSNAGGPPRLRLAVLLFDF